MTAPPLADAFLAARGLSLGVRVASRPTPQAPGDRAQAPVSDLAERLDALCVRAEATSPGLDLARSAFAAFLGAHPLAAEQIAGGEDIADEALFELRLACAMRERRPEAARLFEERYVAPLDATLASLRLDGSNLDEVKQRVREKLCVPDEAGAVRLEGYAGRGRLAGLVQVVATREAVSLARAGQRDRARGDEDPFDLPGAGREPELEIARARYRPELKAAFEGALRSLSSRERNLLRQHVVGGVGLEPLAEIYGVHRATVVRWLARARDQVLSATKATLRERLGVRPKELESLLGLVESRLDVSVERVLRTLDDDPHQ